MRQANFGAVRPFATAAVLALFAVSVPAQVVEKGRTLADLIASHPCDTGLTNRIARVTDCDSATDFGDGDGAFQCWAYCDGSAPWTNLSIGGGGGGCEAPDLSPYVLLAGDSDGQVIQGETGVDKARIELGLGGLGLSRIFSGNPNTFIQVGDAEMYFESSTDGVDANTAVLTLSSNQLYIDIADGEAGLGVNSVTGFNFTGTAMSFNVPAPSASTDTCSAGMFAWDASYIYVCTATDNWERTAVAAW